ncbi:hypothetical protein H9P43_006445 [Blastocladiella emersonii ATCC 22665]|nr:hypothetical protein H9P43_006445 [Blastocladiella emersonii ATCC 22665]
MAASRHVWSPEETSDLVNYLCSGDNYETFNQHGARKEVLLAIKSRLDRLPSASRPSLFPTSPVSIASIQRKVQTLQESFDRLLQSKSPKITAEGLRDRSSLTREQQAHISKKCPHAYQLVRIWAHIVDATGSTEIAPALSNTNNITEAMFRTFDRVYSHLEQDGKESGDVEGVDGQDDAAPASKRSRTSDSSSRRLSDSEFLMGIKEVFQSVATADSKPVLTAALEWVQDAYNDNEEYQIDVATRLTEDQALRVMAVSESKRKRILEIFIQ